MRSESSIVPSDHRLKKIVFCVTEDWFALSHFMPLLDVMKRASKEVVVVTRCSGRHEEIEKRGARVIPFDYQRSSMGPLSNFQCASQLARILKTENPDVLHCVSMKPIILGAVASQLHATPSQVFHVTGLGHVATSNKLTTRLARRISFQILKHSVRSSSSWLLTENQDDLNYLKRNGVLPKNPGLIIPGSGINPDAHTTKPKARTRKLISVAMACRMIKSKGVGDVVKAHQELAKGGIDFSLDLYGAVDPDNPDSYTRSDIENWTAKKNIHWHGFVEDVWEAADIAVLASHDREGMPRSMLEAAAHSLPLIVTDIPGCRDFVRNGKEGFVVPRRNPEALASALRQLIIDQELRQRMGQHARQHVTAGFTEDDVKQKLQMLYDQIEPR